MVGRVQNQTHFNYLGPIRCQLPFYSLEMQGLVRHRNALKESLLVVKSLYLNSKVLALFVFYTIVLEMGRIDCVKILSQLGRVEAGKFADARPVILCYFSLHWEVINGFEQRNYII